MVKSAGRILDEQTLNMLDLRCSGMDPDEIANRLDCTIEHVVTTTDEVFRADSQHVTRDLAGEYW